MTLKNARGYFERLAAETSGRSEVKVYKEFIRILSALERRALSDEELQSIEAELDVIGADTEPENRKKHFSNALRNFKKYLKDVFSLTTKGYYTNMGVGLGTVIGVLIGTVILSRLERSMGISLGIAAGMLIGLLIGRNYDAQAEAAGKLI